MCSKILDFAGDFRYHECVIIFKQIHVSHSRSEGFKDTNMTKSETLQTLAETTGKTKKEVGEMMDAIVALAYKETKKSGEFTIPGLGKLKKKHRPARQGRNPATGETIQIAAKTVIKFTVAKAAKDAIL